MIIGNRNNEPPGRAAFSVKTESHRGGPGGFLSLACTREALQGESYTIICHYWQVCAV
jgi:hypothetical protein